MQAANLIVHDGVRQIVLSGSRGLAGGHRPDSDIDLSLIVDSDQLPPDDPARENFLRAVVQTTLDNWQGVVELDTAAVFDRGDCCGLRCLAVSTGDESILQGRGIDCFGVYKIQRGFTGYVPPVGVDVRRMYPIITIWRR